MNVEACWNNLKEAVYKASYGRQTRNHKDKFDDNRVEIKDLLEEKHIVLQTHKSNHLQVQNMVISRRAATLPNKISAQCKMNDFYIFC